jgi:hypothetical protein
MLHNGNSMFMVCQHRCLVECQVHCSYCILLYDSSMRDSTNTQIGQLIAELRTKGRAWKVHFSGTLANCQRRPGQPSSSQSTALQPYVDALLPGVVIATALNGQLRPHDDIAIDIIDALERIGRRALRDLGFCVVFQQSSTQSATTSFSRSTRVACPCSVGFII